MALPRLTALLTLCLFAPSCKMEEPPLPDGRVLTGADWIPGRSQSSFSTDGEPVVIENVGRHELRIGTGPDTVFLFPGGVHETNGEKTQIYNPAGEQARIFIHAPDASGVSDGIDVHMKHRTEARTIRATYQGEAQPLPAGAARDSR